MYLDKSIQADAELPPEIPLLSPPTQSSPSKLQTPVFTTNNKTSFRHFFSGDKAFDNLDPIQIEKEDLKRSLEKEVVRYSTFLKMNNSQAIHLITDTAKFWLKYKRDLPNLYRLALILLGIPSSSASIERFFSMCGFMSKKQGIISPNFY